LRFKTLFRPEVWGSAITHLLLVSLVLVAALYGIAAIAWQGALILALAVGFSSTVLAAKVLEGAKELRAVHGRVAIGVLIVQDLVAVVALAALAAEVPSPVAAWWLLLPLLRPVLYRVLDLVGHGVLRVLFGAVAALAIGGAGFELVGLSPELGAVLLGVLLSGHRRSQELSSAIWGLKELFLIGFFLDIGLQGLPTIETLKLALIAMLILPLKMAVLFGLLLAFGLRARTSFLTSLSLATYSEFGLILIAAAIDAGWLGNDWLITAALAVAMSFALAALLNAWGHRLYEQCRRWLDQLERKRPHPDDEPITLGSAEILIVGMGRLGTGAYNYLHGKGQLVAGVDSDPGKLERHRREGKRVVYADAEDASFWQRLNIDRIRAVMLAVPEFNAKKVAGRELRSRGYTGRLTATHVYPEEQAPILAASSVMVHQDSSLPIVSILTPDTITCDRSQINLTAIVNPPSAGSTQLWSTIDGTLQGALDSLSIMAIAPGTYVFTVTLAGGGCTVTDQVTVLMDTLVPLMQIVGPTELTCIQTSPLLEAQPINFTGMLDYLWTQAGNPVGQGNTLAVTAAGTWELTWTNIMLLFPTTSLLLSLLLPSIAVWLLQLKRAISIR
jgi:predicted Kef-type K+ transport protein